ncbi:RNA recognition motif domain containing protein [Babesia bovis T2Bo]|uniref:RNA recognition motif containing protein n=1 Tax=Babesia bovis TaxID=5865 RepID=A7AQD9_BABBO|nr:RNA recognition motif domain containing protein [Babesia bovis T2Bo]EDO06758.1 RNA recognition motif domain containing protein [Babesia bovis T2Bo]|eukprot:XP_001610326.1 RNA recognition motif containing protein [Babesia bovis T2Bo]
MEDTVDEKSNIIYVGNLPKALNESNIRKYFEQFGTVKKIRLMKSKKTGNSRGYCFLQFESNEIAKIAAEAMNNYFIDGRVLKVEVKEITPILRRIFRKGAPILSRDEQKQLHVARNEESLKSSEKVLQNILENGKSTGTRLIEGADEVRARLKAAIVNMEEKQEKLGTDIYAASIKKYKKALSLLKP